MSDKLLTISIAAYNVEKFICQTLDSISLPEIIDEIEVFVIDDGGNDNTYKLSKEYEKLFPNSIKVIHKENGGYGSVYNYSISHATGKYFKLLDGDDWFDKDGFIKLIETLKMTTVDVVFTKYNECYDSFIRDGIIYENKYVDKITSIDDFLVNDGIPMHAITYRTEVLIQSKLKLKEHTHYTDSSYISIPMAYVKTILVKNIKVYNYRLGLMNQSVNMNVRIKNFNNTENIYIELVEFYKNLKLYNGNKSIYLKNRIASSCVDHFNVALKLPIKLSTLTYIKNYDNKIKNLSKDIYIAMESLDRKASKVLKILRISNYLLYIPITLVFRNFIN